MGPMIDENVIQEFWAEGEESLLAEEARELSVTKEKAVQMGAKRGTDLRPEKRERMWTSCIAARRG